MNSLLRVAVFILCLGLLLGVTVPFETEANHPLLPAPQPAAPGEVNRIERAATPRAFTSLTISNNPGPANLNLNGHIILGEQSDGIEPALDRLVLALGSDVVILEPGSLRPSGQSNRVWTYQDSKNSRVRKVNLQRNTDRDWQFEISASPISGNQKLYLRLGNDWGGIDLGTGQLLLQMQPALDWAFQAQATIGSGGGTVQTTNAAGVVIRLEVPPGVLAQDTLITMTPLASSPLVASSKAISPGIKFEPEGLQFAEAATLIFDFSATSQTVSNQDSIFLFTSPLTALPLYGTTDPAAKRLTALLHHFSAMGPGAGDPAYMDLRAWAASLLLGTRNLSISELELLAAAIVEDQRTCTQNCIDVGQFAHRVSDSIAALVSATCASSVTNPTDQALSRLLQLEAIGQAIGVDTTALGLRDCMEQVFRALIEQHGTSALINPSATNLARLLNDASKAELLGFSNLDTLALQKLSAALRALMEQGRLRCPTDKDAALQLFSTAERYLAAVVGVDAALASDLQGAKNDCNGASIVEGFYRGSARDISQTHGYPFGASALVFNVSGNEADLSVDLFDPFNMRFAREMLVIHINGSSVVVTSWQTCGFYSCSLRSGYSSSAALTITPDSLSGSITLRNPDGLVFYSLRLQLARQ